MSPPWFGCADRARLRDDPMIGSAPYARGWLLVEHPGPWAREALAGSGIDPTVLRELSTAARTASARILLIRRPGRRSGGDERAWMAVGASRSVRGSWKEDADLRVAASTMRSLAEEESRRAQPGVEPIILVCAHGTHDTCCAVRGRPVAAALAARWPKLVWECSHLGGDRFAPNVIVLPDAAYYGNLEPGSAVEVVSAQLSGRLDVRWLRGLARFPPPAQAAIAELHRRLGPLPAAAVVAESAEQIEAHRWLVRVDAPGSSWLASVVAHRRKPAVLTCLAAAATPATAYVVTGLRRLPTPDPPESVRRLQV